MQQRLLSIIEAARCLGIGRTKLYELVTSGELMLVKVGRKSLITAASIDAFVTRISEADDAEAT